MDIYGDFRIYAERNAFKSFVGMIMTCRGCGDILDCRRAVELDLSDKTIIISCGECADYLQTRLMVANEPTTLFSTTITAPHVVDIYDGRMMIADKPKKPRPRRNPYKRGVMWKKHDELLKAVLS